MDAPAASPHLIRLFVSSTFLVCLFIGRAELSLQKARSIRYDTASLSLKEPMEEFRLTKYHI
jgi:hypothetical protein